MAEKKKTAAKKKTTKKAAPKKETKKTTAKKKPATKKAAAKKTTKKATEKKTTKKAATKTTKKSTAKKATKKTTTKKAAPKKEAKSTKKKSTTTKKAAAKTPSKKAASKKPAAKKPTKKVTKKSTKKAAADDAVEEEIEAKPKKGKKAASKKGDKKSEKSDKKSDKSKNGKAEKKEVAKPTKTLLKEGETWLQGLFEKMALTVKPKGSIDSDTMNYDLTGKSTDHLLGPTQDGKSLEAIGTIMKSSILDSRSPIQIGVDVNGFREKRSEFLSTVAEELANFAAQVGDAVTVAGLNSFERKAIHQTLSDDKRVSTESDGMGVFRKIRLEPRK